MTLVAQLAKSTQNTPFEKRLSSKLFIYKLRIKIGNRILVHFTLYTIHYTLRYTLNKQIIAICFPRNTKHINPLFGKIQSFLMVQNWHVLLPLVFQKLKSDKRRYGIPCP
jgi:hypothetical protein